MTLLFGTATFNSKNHLMIGGCDTTELAQQFKTPLYIYDVAQLRHQARGFKQTFQELAVKHRVVYASKAFSCLAMYPLLQEEGLACDVVSGGELYTALKGEMPPELIEFHGNNKTKEELAYALQAQIGTIVIDNFYEIELLEELLKDQQQTQKVLLRLTPGVNAQTHDYITTGQTDSKFGFDVASGQATQALKRLLASEQLDLQGVHCHIGSQIFAIAGFLAAVEKMMTILKSWQQEYSFTANILNLGGGFGVKYTEADDPLEPSAFVKKIVQGVKEHCQQLAYPLPEIWIEPGRSLIAQAGTTLYTVGASKELPGLRQYVAVDGGMGDNLRPALYEANYSAYLANRQPDAKTETITLVGKYCESGDVLIRNLKSFPLKAGDLLAVPTTGAYGYSMTSNYNRNPRPAVVFVEAGAATLVVRRETYQDLIALDC